ncbi:MAG: SCP-2 sterol transfer family protein [Burkholderiales bacterium]|nr:SCP-2 sterol transfer family protein [Burkholderiales bacterium]
MEFFTQAWVEGFAQKWNADTQMVKPLAETSFSAVIAFGYPGQAMPSVLLDVVKGKVARAGLVNKVAQLPAIDWDLRALPEQWLMWRTKPLTLSSLGVAVQNGQLLFKTGDYRKMIRTPSLANPFLRFFNLL